MMFIHGEPRAAVAQTSGQDPTALAAAFGIHFTPELVANGATPTLPNGHPAIPMDQAISSALDAAPAGVDYTHHQVLAGVQTTVEFGTFTDDRYGVRGVSGNMQPYLQGRSVWIVTFAGPGLQLPAHGAARAGAVHNEVSEVVDATTGEYLMGYSYR
jgi:hypothetical protein